MKNDQREWVFQEGYWIFGVKVRGFVRVAAARIRYEWSCLHDGYMWSWTCNIMSGDCNTLASAIHEAEASLGIQDDD